MPDQISVTCSGTVEHAIGVLLMMDSLSPLERAVFVLREAFGRPYSEIATMLDRSEVAVRQLDHRAGAHAGQVGPVRRR